jgi:hypothetical protein
MSRYAMVDSEGLVTNICEWDGVSEWENPEGITLIKCDDFDPAEPNGTYIDGKFKPAPVVSTETPQQPIAEQIAALQAQLAELASQVSS